MYFHVLNNQNWNNKDYIDLFENIKITNKGDKNTQKFTENKINMKII